MALPTLTPEQRTQALAKAAEARKKRAEVKGELKSGKRTLADVLKTAGDDGTLGKMKVSTVLESLPGVGKGTIVQRLLHRDPARLALSVSVTTRSPRPGEIDGVHYRFVTDEEFDRMVEGGELLEWAEIVGHRSGTPRPEVEDLLGRGTDVILEIDVQGARQIRDRVPGALLVFLAPPTLEELERRLRGRGTESESSIRRRMDLAAREVAESSWFPASVTNDDVDRAADEVAAIIEASRTA